MQHNYKSHLVENILVKKKGFSTSDLMKIVSFVWPQPMFFGIQTHKWSYIVTCVDYLENVNVWYWNFNLKKIESKFKKKIKKLNCANMMKSKLKSNRVK